MAASGSCLCGAVSYRVEGEPLNSVFCYCRDCQKATASDKFFGVWLRKQQFHLLTGELSSFVRIGDSGGKLDQQFCTQCGSLIVLASQEANFMALAGATLEDSSDLGPSMLIHTGSAPAWAVFPDGLPQFKGKPE